MMTFVSKVLSQGPIILGWYIYPSIVETPHRLTKLYASIKRRWSCEKHYNKLNLQRLVVSNFNENQKASQNM